jgi:hypothetical protein
MLVAGQLIVQLTTAAPAAAAAPVRDLLRESAVSASNTFTTKTVTVYCKEGWVVLGGGGQAVESGVPSSHRLTLTRLEPSDSLPFPGGGTRSGYRVSAAATIPGPSGNWWVEGFAQCALPISGRHIVTEATTGGLSPAAWEKEAACPDGERALGSGARINDNSGRQVGLQVARPSGTGHITRARAHEDADGFAGNWNLVVFAVCAPPPTGYEVVLDRSPEEGSQQAKLAYADCPDGTRVIGAGGAITDVAPGNVSLEEVIPFSVRVRVGAAENVPTSQNWDFIAAAAICAITSTT